MGPIANMESKSCASVACGDAFVNQLNDPIGLTGIASSLMMYLPILLQKYMTYGFPILRRYQTLHHLCMKVTRVWVRHTRSIRPWILAPHALCSLRQENVGACVRCYIYSIRPYLI